MNRRWRLWGSIVGAAVVVLGGLGLMLHHQSATTVSVPVTRTVGGQRGGVSRSQSTTSATTASQPTSAPLLMPVSGKIIGNFGWQYSGALNEWYYNPGISIAASSGKTVRAAWAGQVTKVATDPHMGLTVTVNDGDGFSTVYGHLGHAAVKAQQTLRQGQAVGTVGASSIYSRQPGAHVDFQIYRGTTASNPMAYMHPSS